MYDNHILDMYELGVDGFKSLPEFSGKKKRLGSKPIINFLGDQWSNDSVYKNIQNLLIDMFRGDKIDKIYASGMDHVLSFSCIDGRIGMRGYSANISGIESNVKNNSRSIPLLLSHND